MLFEEEDAPLLKKWIVKRLENTSDADADVLADYVLALLRHDGDTETVRALCESEIPDFLKEDSAVFVRDVFNAVLYKAYLPGAHPPRIPSLPFTPPTGPSVPSYGNLGMVAPMGPASGTRKRLCNERGDSDAQDMGFQYGSDLNGRQLKQARRGGSAIGRGNSDMGRGPSVFAGRPPLMNLQNIPPPFAGTSGISNSPGLPPFDPNNPMAALLAMQALGFPVPGTSSFPQTGASSRGAVNLHRKPRCRDYDIKGFCARGNTCMYEHGEQSIWVPPKVPTDTEEYDPAESLMTSISHSGNELRKTAEGAAGQIISWDEARMTKMRGRGRGGLHRGDNRQLNSVNRRGGRAEFSSDRPNYDRCNTTIVVENIPEDRFTEDEVRGFFSEFGKILEVSMKPYKRLAIVKYEDWTSANGAYKSPRVIFDNRFVKVYWYVDQDSLPKPPVATKSNATPKPVSGTAGISVSEPKIDVEEFARKQQEAQKTHEEKQKKKLEMEAAKKELEKRQEELLKSQAEEKKKLMEKIAAKSGKASFPNAESNTPAFTYTKSTSQTEMLKAQLAALEAEAQSLGIDTSLSDNTSWGYRGRGRGRGEYRGRGAYVLRGVRGAYRGHGPAPFASPFASNGRSFNLDNRPRKIAMTGIDFSDAKKDENLKEYLLGVGEYENIEVTPSRSIITFKDRRTAEKFMYSVLGGEIPSVGKVEMTWISNSLSPASVHIKNSAPKSGADEDTNMDDGDAPPAASHTGTHSGFKQEEQQNSNVDYDVAYENDWEQE